MKTAEAKTASSASHQRSNKPFFGKGGNSFFGTETASKESFFTPIQAKLSIGKVNDPYEKEADAMADKVVQRLAGPEVQTKTEERKLSNAGTQQIQSKCSHCETEAAEKEEEQVQKKEDTKQEETKKLNLKPADADAEKTVLKKAAAVEAPVIVPVAKTAAPAATPGITATTNNTIQAKSSVTTVAKATDTKEEQPQEKEEENGQDQKKLHRKPIFDSNAEPPDDENTIQRSCRECEEGNEVLMKPMPGMQLKPADQTPKSDGSRTSIVAAAQGEIGKVEARSNDGTGSRVGGERLLEYFHIAAPGVWDDSIITTAGAEMPSWCGIFSVWAHKKAGKDIGEWQMGKGVSAFNTLTTTDNPQPGDIGYIHETKQHHALVKEVAGDTIHTIDGNSGTNSEVKENTKPRSAYDLFMTAFGGGGSTDNVQAKGNETTQPSSSGSAETETNSSIESRLNSSKGKGTALPDNTRTDMEQSIGADFSNVRIHTDTEATQLSSNLNAQAFTHGSDIYFNNGKYDTGSTAGKHLLAHELTHTVQQGAALNRKTLVQRQGVEVSDSEVETIAQAVYDALDGWTSSTDSANIRTQLGDKSQSSINRIIPRVASLAGNTSVGIFEWLKSDMVDSDWQAVRNHFVHIRASHIEDIIAAEVYDLLSGATTGEDSREILQLFAGNTPLLGEQLSLVLQKLEAKTEENSNDTADWLFDDLTNVHADSLVRHFFGSGSLSAIQYGTHWIANKIKNMISGYTGIGDSHMIVVNFERVPEGVRSFVLYELDRLCNAEWSQSAADALMEDMQQEDYERLRELMPGQLPVYNIQQNWLEWAWDKITIGFDYVEGWIESLVCGIAGALWGILLVVWDIIVLIWELLVAIYNLVGWVINKISFGRLAREEAESVESFFTGIGEFFGAPGEAISHMWNEMVQESALIEGPFRECQQAFYWMTRVANLLVNIVLIFAFGYGAVKLAAEAIEGLVTLVRAGELLAALGRLPGRMFTAIRGLPAAAARNIASGVSRVIRLIRNPVVIVESARNTYSIVRLAAQDEGFFSFLRQQAGRSVANERQFWQDRRAFWTQSADRAGADLGEVEGKLVQAVDSAVNDPARSRALITEAETGATASRSEADDLLNDITGAGGTATQPLESRLPEIWREGMPGRPPMLGGCVTRLQAAGISEDTIVAIIRNASIHTDYNAAEFFGDLNRFVLRMDSHVGRDGFNRIIQGLAGESDFLAARFLMIRVSFGQHVTEILGVFSLEDITVLRSRFPGGTDAEFVNNLRSIVTRVSGSRDDIMALLNEAGTGQQGINNLNSALDRLGDGRYTPDQIRQSLAFGAELQQAIATSADDVARTIWGDAFAGRDADGRIQVAEALTRDRSGDLASAHIRARRAQIASVVLRGGEGGTEIDAINWGVIREVLLNTDLPTVVKNDILGEIWSFTKVRQYENLGYVAVREVHIRMLNTDGSPTDTYAKVDAVFRRGNELLYREFKSSATADTSAHQDIIYGLLNEGATNRLRPFGAGAEAAFGGPGMPNFRAGPVVIERP